MTEQMVPMGGTAVAEPPAPLAPTDVDEVGDAGNRRKLIAVGAALAVLVVAFAGYFLTKGGGSAANDGFVVPHHTVPVAAKKAPHHAKATKPVKLPKAFKGHVGRDPFKPLYVAPVAAPTTDKAAGSTDTGTPTGPRTRPTPGPSTPTAPGTDPTPGATPTVRHYHAVWLQLVKINGPKSATFVVGYS